MQVSVETQGLEHRLAITVPADSVDTAVKSRLQQLAKTQRINGFRPGKVPVSVIKKRFGEAVRQEVAGEVMQRNFFEAVIKEKLNPAGMPSFELKSNVDGQDLEFVAVFESYPEVKLQGLDEVEVEKTVVEITDGDLDEMMKTLQKQHATWKETKRKIRKDDKVTIDFVGTVDGEEFEGGKAEGFTLELGQGRMIPGFEDPIVGAKAGDEVEVNVTFPDDYHAENLKGKDAQFKVTIQQVEGLNLPKVDEEFAKLFGIEDGDVEALRAEVKKNMQRELDQTLKAQLKESVIAGLLDKNKVELPKALVAQEIGQLREQAKQRFGQQPNVPDLPDELFKENAERRVSVGVLLGEVIKEHKIEVDDAKVKELIETTASAYEDPTEVIEYYNSNEQLMQQIKNLAIEEQAIEKCLELAKVTEVSKKFDEIMNKQA